MNFIFKAAAIGIVRIDDSRLDPIAVFGSEKQLLGLKVGFHVFVKIKVVRVKVHEYTHPEPGAEDPLQRQRMRRYLKGSCVHPSRPARLRNLIRSEDSGVV